jgi:Cu(I)/Ag(I) efflux system membrane protein CusA/SilA
MEGALLRLRPKVMTVSTVIAGLLPIMWSNRVGAEVMKPLATPVLGGMVSSLVHVLIVTPVIFFWLRERQLGLEDEPLPDTPRRTSSRRAAIAATAVGILVVVGAYVALRPGGRGNGSSPPGGTDAAVIQTIPAGDLEIVLRSPEGALRQGRNTFSIEFRRRAGGTPVDVGTVLASGTMTMPGMVMPSGLQVTRTNVAGRYLATAEFGMAGAWQMAIEWNGPAGQGSVNFQGSVQ